MQLKRVYRLPIMGKVLNDMPLTGDESSPLQVIPLAELPNVPTYYDEELGREVKQGFAYTCLNYNVDEEWCEVELEASQEYHDWLTNLLPQLRDIVKNRKWKLDKTELTLTGT